MSNATPDHLAFAEVPNHQIASVGRAFRETADYLNCRLQVGHAIPLLMMGTFGIEMYLKSLNSKNVYNKDEGLTEIGGYRVTAKSLTKSHALVKLFDDIQEMYRQQLETAYANRPAVSGKQTIREALAVYDTLFETARYPFEDGNSVSGISITELIALLDVIADHVGSLPKRVVYPQGKS